MFVVTKLDYEKSNTEIEGIYKDRKNALQEILNIEDNEKNKYNYKIKENNYIKVYEKGYMGENLKYIYQIIKIDEIKDDPEYKTYKLFKDN